VRATLQPTSAADIPDRSHQVSAKPAAVTAWTDFRANQINGDIYVAVSH